MSYNSKNIKRDAAGNGIPQYFNPATDQYEVAEGANGAINVNIKESALPEGAATEAKQDALLAKDFATEATLEEVVAKLTTLLAKDFATQTTLADILAKIIAAPATEAKQNTIISHIDQIEGYIDNVESLITAIKDTAGIKKIVDPLPAGTNVIGKTGLQVGGADVAQANPVPVSIIGSLPKSQMEYYGATVADRPAANTVPVGAVYMAVNSGEVWQSNGISWVVM